MMAKVTFPDGWARSCITWKMGRRQTARTRTRGFPNEVSHTTGLSTPGKQMFASLSEEAGSSSMGD